MSTDRAGGGAKAGVRRRISAATVVEAGRLYERTELPQTVIARRLGMHVNSLRRIAQDMAWVRPEAQAVARRGALVRNVRAKVDEEIEKSERVFEGLGPATDAERSARTLASLMRTLREISKYDDERARATPRGDGRGDAHGDPHGDPDEAVDIDEFRDTLADRLDRLRQERDG